MKISDDGCPQFDMIDDRTIGGTEARMYIAYANDQLRKWFASQPLVTGNAALTSWGKESNGNDAHQARLCGIVPIKEDTAEDVLRDFLTYRGTLEGNEFERTRDLAVRARKVLERGEF